MCALHLVAAVRFDDTSRPHDELVSAALRNILETYDRKWKAMTARIKATAPSQQRLSATAGCNIAETVKEHMCEEQVLEYDDVVEREDCCRVFAGREDMRDELEGRRVCKDFERNEDGGDVLVKRSDVGKELGAQPGVSDEFVSRKEDSGELLQASVDSSDLDAFGTCSRSRHRRNRKRTMKSSFVEGDALEPPKHTFSAEHATPFHDEMGAAAGEGTGGQDSKDALNAAHPPLQASSAAEKKEQTTLEIRLALHNEHNVVSAQDRAEGQEGKDMQDTDEPVSAASCMYGEKEHQGEPNYEDI